MTATLTQVVKQFQQDWTAAILILASRGVRGCQWTPTWLRWVSPENQGGSDDESFTLR
jgi:hypothetical protein